MKRVTNTTLFVCLIQLTKALTEYLPKKVLASRKSSIKALPDKYKTYPAIKNVKLCKWAPITYLYTTYLYL